MEKIAKVISDQIQFNNQLNPESCYDEIVGTLLNLGINAYTIRKVDKPTRVLKSENFQYLLSDSAKSVQIINKFYK